MGLQQHSCLLQPLLLDCILPPTTVSTAFPVLSYGASVFIVSPQSSTPHMTQQGIKQPFPSHLPKAT